MALTTRIHACHYGDTNSSKTVTELKYKKKLKLLEQQPQPPVLRPLYRSTCVSRHLHLSGGFCWTDGLQTETESHLRVLTTQR